MNETRLLRFPLILNFKDECTWTGRKHPNRGYDNYYATSCGKIYQSAELEKSEIRFCPYCGGRIRRGQKNVRNN